MYVIITLKKAVFRQKHSKFIRKIDNKILNLELSIKHNTSTFSTSTSLSIFLSSKSCRVFECLVFKKKKYITTTVPQFDTIFDDTRVARGI